MLGTVLRWTHLPRDSLNVLVCYTAEDLEVKYVNLPNKERGQVGRVQTSPPYTFIRFICAGTTPSLPPDLLQCLFSQILSQYTAGCTKNKQQTNLHFLYIFILFGNPRERDCSKIN